MVVCEMSLFTCQTGFMVKVSWLGFYEHVEDRLL